MKLKSFVKSVLGVFLIISTVILFKMNVTKDTSVIINENAEIKPPQNYSEIPKDNGTPVTIPPDNSLDVKHLPIPSSNLSLPVTPLLKNK